MNANLTFARGGFLHRTRFVLVNDRVPRTDTLRTVRQRSRERLRAGFTNAPDLLRHAVPSGRGR